MPVATIEPDMLTDPVNVWVSSDVSPNLVDPLEYCTVIFVIEDDTINSFTVNLPSIITFSLVYQLEPVNAKIESPEVPSEPEVPLEPEVPVLPDEPEDPLEPDVPDEPLVPSEPEVPAVPEEPLEPDEPEVPAVPVNPGTPNGISKNSSLLFGVDPPDDNWLTV